LRNAHADSDIGISTLSWIERAAMANPTGESNDEALKLDFDRRLMLQFRGSVVTSDAGLLAYRELDDALGLTKMAIERLADARTGRNGRHALVGLLRQSVFGRLAGYEDVNDAERLRHDPAMRWIVGGKAAQGSAASPSLAGIAPGLLLSLMCGGLAFWLSQRHCYGSIAHRFSIRKAIFAFVAAVPALIIPALIVVGVVWGVFTLTESAGAAALYALAYALVRGVIRRDMPWKELANAFHRTAIDTAVVLILIGGSNLLSWVLARSQLPQMIVASMHGFGLATTLLLINLLLLVFGMFLEPAASVLLASSILLPLVKSLHIDLVHFGIIMIVNLQIGVLLPPIGASALVASRMAAISFETQVRALMPFIMLGLVTLIFVTYMPGFSLWIPTYFSGR
jgi:TRAP-type C4-dicarboxylate transport system permease large subunit